MSDSVKVEYHLVPPPTWNDKVEEIYQHSDFLDHFFGGGKYLAAYAKGYLVGGIAYCFGSAPTGGVVTVALPEFFYGGPWGEYRQQVANQFFKCRDADAAVLIDASGEVLDLPNKKELLCEIIPLTSYEAWLRGIDPDARNQIRQAGRNKLYVGPVTRKRFLVPERDTARRQGHRAKEEWTSKLFSFAEKYGTAIGVYRGQRLLGGVVLFKHGRKAYLVKHASIQSGFRYRPNHLLYAEAVKWAIQEGCTSLNTGGAAYDGLRQFKQSLGSGTHTYYWYSGIK